MIRPTVTIKADFKRLAKLKAEFERAKDAYVAVGVHEGAGAYEDGTSVVQVALWNEFGTEHIPARPFIRNAIYGNVALINAWRAEVIKGILAGTLTIAKALKTLGFRVRELIRNSILSNTPPPNAASTLAAKKRAGTGSQTLLDTRLLLRSIDFRVVGA